MLSLPKINTGDFEETLSLLLGEAERLSKNGGGWKNLGESSPLTAITELLTFIALTQRENMNKINGRVLFRLGALFGEAPTGSRPARALASVTGSGRIKKGDRFKLGDVLFEAECAAEPNDNLLTFLGTEIEGETLPLCSALENLSATLFDGSDNVIFGFSKPFDPEKPVSLTLALDDFKRAALNDLTPDNFECGSRLAFEYYGIENETIGWHPVKACRDLTLSLLRTAIVTFSVGGSFEALGGNYCVRIIAERNRFDRLPTLKGVYTSVVPLTQTETLIKTLDFSRAEFRENKMYYSAALPADAVTELYLLTGGGYVPATDVGVNFKIKDSKGDDRLITSSRKKIAEELFASLPEDRENALLRLVIYEKPFIRDILKFSADGSAFQSFPLGFSGAIPSEIKALSSNGDGTLSEWLYKSNLNGAEGDERVFDLFENRLLFGDNISGSAPFGNDLRIIGLTLTSGERGNLPAGELKTDLNGIASAKLIAPSLGGTDEESAAEFFARTIAEKKQGTMLSEQDFCERALKTPGLLLRDAHAFSDTEGVTVVIDPDIPSFEEKRGDYDYYLTNIKNYMKQFKPLGLTLKVMFPIYIGVDVKMEVSGSLDGKALEAALKRETEDFFAALSSTAAEYSELHKRIAGVRGVAAIHGLSIEAESVHVRRTVDGGLTFPESVRLRLKQCVVNVSRDY